MKKIFITLSIFLSFILIFTSCSDNKKSASENKETKAIEVKDLPNPCELVSTKDIQETLNIKVITSNNGDPIVNPLSKACSWIPAGEDPYSVNVTIEVEDQGSNEIDSSLSMTLDPKDTYQAKYKGAEIYTAPKLKSTLLTKDNIIYSVRVSGNDKDFTSDSNVPQELFDVSNKQTNATSDTVTSYLIAIQIANSL